MARMFPSDVTSPHFQTTGEERLYGFLREYARPDSEILIWYELRIESSTQAEHSDRHRPGRARRRSPTLLTTGKDNTDKALRDALTAHSPLRFSFSLTAPTHQRHLLESLFPKVPIRSVRRHHDAKRDGVAEQQKTDRIS